MRFCFAAMPMIIVACCLLGCNSETKLYPVSGKVMYDGKPLPAGVIWFDPDPVKNKGPQGYAVIKNGEYSTVGEGGRGVAGGVYLIRIEGFDGKPGNELPLGKPLFSNFQQTADLPKADSTQDFDVPRKQ